MEGVTEGVMEGARVGPYTIAGALGAGGMGLVYQAVDEASGRRAAIKLLRPELADDAEAIERLRTEARVLAAIGHPGVIELYDHGRTAWGAPFLALELVEGETVAQRIAARGPLAAPDALALVRRIAEPLAEVHGRGVVHRDLKPDNVVLLPGDDSLGRVKLFDFGIATVAGDPAAPPGGGMVVGTPAYMAPEQCVGTGACDHRADLYALGCLLFELLAGTSPYGFLPTRGVLVAHVRGPVPDVAVHAEVPASVARLVARLLAKAPDDRPRDAHHVIDLIDSILRPGRQRGRRSGRRLARGTGAHAELPRP